MRYYVTWKDKSFRTTKEGYVEYTGFQAELVEKLGRELLKAIAASSKMSESNLRLTMTDRAAVVHSTCDGVVGSVVVDQYRGESMNRILRGLL